MRDKYGVGNDPYCYRSSDVLINLLNIQDQTLLDEAEIAFTAVRYKRYESTKVDISQFTFTHFKYLHYYLFQDLYEWSGQLRTVDISKRETRFCTSRRIEPEAKKIFSRIPSLLNINNDEEFIHEISDIFCEINMLHPFREGNGRVQRFFFEEMLFVLGYETRWPDLSTEEWLSANIAAVNLNLNLLKKIFEQAISEL